MDTSEVEIRFQDGRTLHMQGEWEAALDAYRAVLALDPRHFRALTNLGDCLDRLGRNAEAEAAFAQACAAAPNEARPRYNLARQHHLRGDLEAAEAGYRRALELDPRLIEAALNLGRLLEESGRVGEAGSALQQAVERQPESAAAQLLLGHLRFEQQRPLDALIAYWRAAEIAPDGETHFHIGKTLQAMRRVEEAAQCYRRALALDPHSKGARESLARALFDTGKRAEAIAALKEWLSVMPDEPIAQHMLAAFGEADAPERASDGYVRATFENFAGVFDRTLERLDYRAPQLIAEVVARHLAPPAGALDVLDAGCGTGLCGPLLRPYARRLVGVDLSPQMLAQAERRGGYDELIEGELTGYLRTQRAAFDLIAGADTLCYFGALEEASRAAAAALKANGLLVFTLERLDDDAREYQLAAHGRYSHSPAYVERTLAAAGLQVLLSESAVLRNEGGQPVQGFAVLARATNGGPATT